jgi:hypothetical protein
MDRGRPRAVRRRYDREVRMAAKQFAQQHPLDTALRAHLRTDDTHQQELAKRIGRQAAWLNKYIHGAGARHDRRRDQNSGGASRDRRPAPDRQGTAGTALVAPPTRCRCAARRTALSGCRCSAAKRIIRASGAKTSRGKPQRAWYTVSRRGTEGGIGAWAFRWTTTCHVPYATPIVKTYTIGNVGWTVPRNGCMGTPKRQQRAVPDSTTLGLSQLTGRPRMGAHA